MRSEIKGFGTVVSEILYAICEDPTYARFTVASFITELKNERKSFVQERTKIMDPEGQVNVNVERA